MAYLVVLVIKIPLVQVVIPPLQQVKLLVLALLLS